jgi:hypothetical protein
LYDYLCPACYRPHDFYYPDGDCLIPGRTYEFVCPVSGQVAALRPGSAHDFAAAPPPGAVILRLVSGEDT